jgi:hypothetical protein
MKLVGDRFSGFGVRMIGVVCMATVFLCVVAISPTFAQDTTAAEEQYADQDVQQDGSCPNPTEVAKVETTSDNTRTPFKISGETFRVSYDVTFEDPDGFNLVEIDIEDRFGLVAFENVGENGSDSFIVTEGPGSFELVVNVTPNNGATYTVTVEDCAGEDSSTPGETTDPEGVEKGTIPKQPLPPTGGLPLMGLVVLGLALVGVGSSIVRAGIGRRS